MIIPITTNTTIAICVQIQNGDIAPESVVAPSDPQAICCGDPQIAFCAAAPGPAQYW
jgi:hypothetical protein